MQIKDTLLKYLIEKCMIFQVKTSTCDAMIHLLSSSELHFEQEELQKSHLQMYSCLQTKQERNQNEMLNPKITVLHVTANRRQWQHFGHRLL